MGGEGKSPYAASGVDYDQLDPFKRACQEAAKMTLEGSTAEQLDIHPLDWTRGESAFVMKPKRSDSLPPFLIAHVEEGLGTKNLVADAMAPLLGKQYYGVIAQDTVAMIVNDLVTLGMMPLSIAMHLAVGNSAWFRNTERTAALIGGWVDACRQARCIWSGGETPTLKDVILPNACALSGSAIGIGQELHLLSPEKIQDGDAIVLLRSTGIHANGLTLARKIAKHLSRYGEAMDGYLVPLPDGTPYGEALLKPTPIYVNMVERLIQSADARYAVNITGHGWRKLMRAPIDAEYIIEKIPEPHPVFRFMQMRNPDGPISDRDAYADLNMGAGFAVFINPKYVDRIPAISETCKIDAMVAGYIRKPGPRRVVIKPLDIIFEANTLQVR